METAYNTPLEHPHHIIHLESQQVWDTVHLPISQVAKHLGISRTGLTRLLNGQLFTTKGYMLVDVYLMYKDLVDDLGPRKAKYHINEKPLELAPTDIESALNKPA